MKDHWWHKLLAPFGWITPTEEAEAKRLIREHGYKAEEYLMMQRIAAAPDARTVISRRLKAVKSLR